MTGSDMTNAHSPVDDSAAFAPTPDTSPGDANVKSISTGPGDELRQAIVKCFYDEQIDTDEDEWEPREENIEYFDTSAVIDRLNRLMLTEIKAELEAAITECNRLQEHMAEPSRDLKYGNGYLLDRIEAIDAQLNKEETDGDAPDRGETAKP